MILSALKDGPKRYEELPRGPTLDFQLRSLLNQRKIVKVYDYAGVCRFSLPIRDSETQNFCAGCGVEIADLHFKRCRACRKKYNEYSKSRGKNTCRVCGAKTRNDKYCSLPCKSKATRISCPTCRYCGGPTKRRMRLYCSVECSNKGRWMPTTGSAA